MQHVSLAVGGAGGAEVESRLPKAGWTWAVWQVKFMAEQRVVLRGRSSSVLLRVQLPLAAAHRRDEGGPLAAAVLGKQEVDVTFRGELFHGLLEDPREAGGRGGVDRW